MATSTCDGSQAPRRAVRRATVVAAVVAVLASYSVAGPVSNALASTLTGSNFEIDTDANLVSDGAQDWLVSNALRITAKNDEPSGANDDSFTEGTHESSIVPTTEAGSIPPNKSDLKSFGLFTESNDSGVYLNVFWTRVQDPNGDTNMDFEFNQSDTLLNDPADSEQLIPVRTTGDLLITYDLANGGTTAVVSKRTWQANDTWSSVQPLTAAQALGTINSSPITAANSGGLGALSARTFGEASVNLTSILPPEQGCRTFGSVYLKSRSSDSFNAALKDFIAPQAADISNCGSITIHKTDDNGALAGAGFTLYKDVAPIGGSVGVGDTVVAGTCVATNASGNCTISDVKKGEYWLVETTVPAGHDGALAQHVSITAGDQVVPTTFNDPIQKGTIRVTKDAVPDDAQDFSFSLDGGAAFHLDDDADATLSNTTSFTVPVGAHSLSEVNIPSGWVPDSLVCDDPTHNTTVVGSTATIALAKDETVDCLYTNAFTKLGVNLQTQAATADGGGWNDTASLTGDGSHVVTGTVAFFACAAQATATACTTGGTAAGSSPVTHVSGSAYTAATPDPYVPSAYGWSCFRAEFTSTSPYYNSSSHTNATTECFLKQAGNLTVGTTADASFGRDYTWTVEKDVDDNAVSIGQGATATSHYTVTVGNSHTDSAWQVTGTITVTNPNSVPVTGVTVTDALSNNASGSCSVTSGTNVTVPANGSTQRSYTCTFGGSAPSPVTGTDTATATWDGPAFFTPASSAQGTDTVNFSTVTPSVTDETVTVTDSVKGTLGTLDAGTADNPTVYTYAVDRTGEAGTCTTYPNTATVDSADDDADVTSSEDVELCVGSGLIVTGSASGSFDREYLWSIGKAVDQDHVDLEEGQTAATFAYTVTATPDGMKDSGYAVSGSLTVSNPNDWEDVVADVTVTTDLGGGSDCAVTDGVGQTVPQSGSIEVTYACTFTGTPATSGTVTATATWDAAAASTPGATAGLTSPVTLDVDEETNATVTVVDDKTNPGSSVTLGTADWADGPQDFTYSLTQTPEDACTTYTNTAELTETGQSDTVDVEACPFTGGGGVITLPRTGDSTGLIARWALSLLASGALLLLFARRRRTS